MKATFLGTGCAMVLKRYNTCFLLEEGTSKLLVDAGGGSEDPHPAGQAGNPRHRPWRHVRDPQPQRPHSGHSLGHPGSGHRHGGGGLHRHLYRGSLPADPVGYPDHLRDDPGQKADKIF